MTDKFFAFIAFVIVELICIFMMQLIAIKADKLETEEDNINQRSVLVFVQSLLVVLSISAIIVFLIKLLFV